MTRLQEVNVTVLSPDLCGAYYPRRIRSSMVCAGRDGGGADACQVGRASLVSVSRVHLLHQVLMDPVSCPRGTLEVLCPASLAAGTSWQVW